MQPYRAQTVLLIVEESPLTQLSPFAFQQGSYYASGLQPGSRSKRRTRKPDTPVLQTKDASSETNQK